MTIATGDRLVLVMRESYIFSNRYERVLHFSNFCALLKDRSLTIACINHAVLAMDSAQRSDLISKLSRRCHSIVKYDPSFQVLGSARGKINM